MNDEWRERGMKLRVGIFILAAVVAFLGMIYALGARARLFEPRYTIHAEFTEVGGLTEGATVRLAGVQIGRVTGVHLPGQPGGKVRVDLTIARRFHDRIRADSVARIETQGLLGDKIVEVTVGSARAPAIDAGGTIAARDPVDIAQVFDQGAESVKNVAALTENLGRLAASLTESGIVEDAGAATASARRAAERLERIVDRIEQGRGWARALLYEEPVALRRLTAVIESTQKVLDRVERGEGALGVLSSRESGEAARRFLAAMERLGGAMEGPPGDEGLLPALLLDPKYRTVLDDLRVAAGNLRQISERVAGGRGTLGSLVKDEADGGLRLAVQDLRAAIANLKEITERINEGEGTLGALIADPTVYERLVTILEGAQRSRVLRFLLRRLGEDGAAAGKDE